MNDPINPNHYKQGGIESIDAIKAFMSEEAFKGFLKGNCQKYLFRYEKKNGIEDLRKCQWYLDRLVQELKKEEDSFHPVKDIAARFEGVDVRQGPPIALDKEVSASMEAALLNGARVASDFDWLP
jgi:hypothetical protein